MEVRQELMQNLGRDDDSAKGFTNATNYSIVVQNVLFILYLLGYLNI